MKKAVSPLISAVLVMIFTITVGSAMATWMFDYTKTTTESATEATIGEKGITYCANSNIEISNINLNNQKITENQSIISGTTNYFNITSIAGTPTITFTGVSSSIPLVDDFSTSNNISSSSNITITGGVAKLADRTPIEKIWNLNADWNTGTHNNTTTNSGNLKTCWNGGLYCDWGYRNNLTVNGSTTTLTDYQVKIIVNWSVGMNTTFDDLRFSYDNSSTEIEIPYWVESYTATNATVWVKANITIGNNSIFMYYGNSLVASQSNQTVVLGNMIIGYCGIKIYDEDLSGPYTWKTGTTACDTPQCGLDGAQDGDNLVEDNSVSFSIYPARNACKTIGGRLPTKSELSCIKINQNSLGEPLVYDYHWSATEYSAAYSWSQHPGLGTPTNTRHKASNAYVRCVISYLNPEPSVISVGSKEQIKKGTYLSETTSTAESIVSITPTWASTELHENTNFTVDISANDGSSWCMDTTNNTEYTSCGGIGTGTNITFRVNFNTNDTTQTAILHNMTLNYAPYASTGELISKNITNNPTQISWSGTKLENITMYISNDNTSWGTPKASPYTIPITWNSLYYKAVFAYDSTSPKLDSITIMKGGILTQNPRASINNNANIIHTGTLADGQTATLDINANNFTIGQNNITIYTDAGIVDYDIKILKLSAVISNTGMNKVTVKQVRAFEIDGTNCILKNDTTTFDVGDVFSVSGCSMTCDEFLAIKAYTDCTGVSAEYTKLPSGC